MNPKFQKFMTMVEASIQETTNQTLTPEQNLQNLDNSHCDLFKAVLGDGSRARIKNGSVEVAAQAFLVALKKGVLND